VVLRGSRSFELQAFEHLIATPGTALLRVLSVGPDGGDPDHRPTLLVDDGQTVHRFAALPAPADPPGTLRAAYSVPVGLLGPQSTYALELSGGTELDLPTPTPGSRRAASPEHERLAARVDELEARLEREARDAAVKLSATEAAAADADQRAASSAADAAAVAEAFAAEAAASQARTEALERQISELEESVEHERDARAEALQDLVGELAVAQAARADAEAAFARLRAETQTEIQPIEP
jgi:DNA repair exonuclease SbcCD ATPase subunit